VTATPSAADVYASATLPGDATHWRDAAYCVLDLETTGLNPRRDEIVSYGAVPVDDGCIVMRGACHALVRPRRPVSPSSVRIHGIRPEDVAGAPALDAVLDDLLTAMAGRVVVVHVDWVERGFLGRALQSRGVRLREPVLDTAQLAHAQIPGLPATVALPSLAARLGLPVYSRHEALGDALTTAQVFLALATLMDRRGELTVGDLCRNGACSGRRSALRRITGH
jgi:DNA polymerase-3 subunit epsilon